MTMPLTVDQLHPRLAELTVVDVRSPGEYAAGHIPGAHNVPLDRLGEALPTLRAVAGKSGIAVVCASGNRSRTACDQLAAAGITALALTGGTSAWADGGHPLRRLPGARAVWAPDRQVRLAAGSLVVAGVLADLVLPGARWFSAVVGAGLVLSAVTDTCAMGNLLGRLPHNRPRPTVTDLDTTLAALRT
ncbi:transporter [Kitasatospora sp. NE20-6]|uniref:rhodanese-like domain-containing protein n=1 Tax=Kitasatospora sp. NE20-6 TaxID=2859066 RepID=UPI0034DBD806